MGLHVSHGCWTGSYGAFDRWRRELATSAGIDIFQMVGWGGHIEWETLPDDPLHRLLSCSDCEAVLEAEHLLALADRLRDLVPHLPLQARQDALQFAAGLRIADSLKQDVCFR